MDPAGNTWSQTFTLLVEPVDDPPVIAEFPSIIPVEHEMETTINMTWSDVDSTSALTASTNRSWASVDLSGSVLTVTSSGGLSHCPGQRLRPNQLHRARG